MVKIAEIANNSLTEIPPVFMWIFGTASIVLSQLPPWHFWLYPMDVLVTRQPDDPYFADKET